jgi:hypothetical protein
VERASGGGGGGVVVVVVVTPRPRSPPPLAVFASPRAPVTDASAWRRSRRGRVRRRSMVAPMEKDDGISRSSIGCCGDTMGMERDSRSRG